MCSICTYGWLLTEKPIDIACLQGKGLAEKASCADGCIESVARLSTNQGRQILVRMTI